MFCQLRSALKFQDVVLPNLLATYLKIKPADARSGITGRIIDKDLPEEIKEDANGYVSSKPILSVTGSG